MQLTTTGKAAENTVAYRGELLGQGGGAVHFRGAGARVEIGERCRASNVHFNLGDNCRVVIGDHVALGRLRIHAERDVDIVIGDGASFTWVVDIQAHEAHAVTIGRGCLFANRVFITVSDMHSILDQATGERINPGAPVHIGDRVWIGYSATVLKGSRIGSGSIIGAHALVSGEIPEHCLAAGVPARVIRQGVAWDERLL